MSYRRAAKIDANQPEIIDGLRDFGATVQPLSAVGGGCPDLLVGYRLRNYLIEIKNKDGRANRKKILTPDQETWHGMWSGQKSVVFTLEEAISVITGEEYDQ